MMMEIRVTSTRNTAGRPILAVLIMLALLALSMLAAWAVSAYKTNQPIVLGRPVPLSQVNLFVSAPKGWFGGETDEARAGTLAQFFEQDQGSRQPKRQLSFYQVELAPATAGDVIGRLFQGQFTGRVETRAPIGPLPGRQVVLHLRAGDTRIVRTAVVGPGRYLVIQLFCLGPPTPYELRLMDVVCEGVSLNSQAFVPIEQLADAGELGLGELAGEWLVVHSGAKLIVLPTAAGGTAPSFWGDAAISLADDDPDADIEELIRQRARAKPAVDRESILPAAIRMLQEYRKGQVVRIRQARVPALPGKIEKLTAGKLTYWRLRRPGDGIVHFTYLFRPLPRPARATQPDGGSADLADAGSAPVMMIEGWCAEDDEPSAVAAFQRLIPPASGL